MTEIKQGEYLSDFYSRAHIWQGDRARERRVSESSHSCMRACVYIREDTTIVRTRARLHRLLAVARGSTRINQANQSNPSTQSFKTMMIVPKG